MSLSLYTNHVLISAYEMTRLSVCGPFSKNNRSQFSISASKNKFSSRGSGLACNVETNC